MPRNQGTSRKGKPKKEMRAAGFGKALQRSQVKRWTPKSNGASAHGQGMMGTGATSIGIEDPTEGTKKMKSVLEVDDLSDFLLQAQLANKDFESEREQFLEIDTVAREYVPAGGPQEATFTSASRIALYEDKEGGGVEENFAFQELSVPRRPAWTPGVTTAEELDQMENDTFLEWRRGVARREEQIAAMAFAKNGGGVAGASVTPYEKNLHVWRQLWRVLERSAVVLQIVDARNPLFYLSDDLRAYAMDELGKPMLMLVNKSDYLTEGQRRAWSEYFTKRGIDHLFFSAYDEQKKIDQAVAEAKKGMEVDELQQQQKIVSDDEEDSDADENDGGEEDEPSSKPQEAAAEMEPAQSLGDSIGVDRPLTREELIDTLDSFAKSHGCEPEEKFDNRIQYGMVGFPNVGKSSVINVLVGSSKAIHGGVRVAVAAQPGKTKHFQTLLLPDRSDMMLCDCPGLVFPSFVSSTADMIAAGVYPIAQMRDHWPVVSLICKRVPREVLNTHYGMHIPEPTKQELKEKGWTGKDLPPPTAEELLGTYCIVRSMLAAASGVPDYQRASRHVVKDYSEGKLLYCHSPPALKGDDSIMNGEEYQRETLTTAIKNTNNLKKKEKMEQAIEMAAAKKENMVDVEEDFDDFDAIFGDEIDRPTEGDKRGKSHKKIKQWGKKGRKLRNKDPYGCHSAPNDMLHSAAKEGSGVIINAGKYTRNGYTRANYAGAKSAAYGA
ncbi:Ras GTPase, GNL1-like [Skeletonema marinoi]|uniref:Ras GTPase, GNL1-like n=3 Tax=Skeletonema marinoi TaxID=267567 RepID=A0AAD9DEQ7_9STRA|nr:Ras GTPase, GNL1-like [Skeletonema marinoi]